MEDWLGASQRAAAAVGALLDRSTRAEKAEYAGTVGEGGDYTLVIDAQAENAVFAELDVLHAGGARFCAISEERGEVDYGSPDLRVIIDPIDGSTNAKRGLPHHSISIAVADGPTMGDMLFGYVYDFGPGEEWWAIRGEGAFLDGQRLLTDVPERRSHDGKLELLGIESADPRWIRDAADELAETAHRIRALGTIAVTLCQVAAARMDGMITLRRSRAVDTAAGQLIVREAGGCVAFLGYDDPLGAPLDAEPRAPIIAARTPGALRELLRVPLQ
jgi:myo-inositol-1(or 4)-monophosphatase